jgi:hypothetical protein
MNINHPKNRIVRIEIETIFSFPLSMMVMIIETVPPFCVYEKQPLIAAVHELIVDFRDDILTIFPKIYVFMPLCRVFLINSLTPMDADLHPLFFRAS